MTTSDVRVAGPPGSIDTEGEPASGSESGATDSHAAGDRPTGEAAAGEEAPDTGYRTIRIPQLPMARIVGAAMIGIGLLIVAFLVYLFVFTPLTASRDQQRLAASVSGQPLTVFKLVDGHRPPEGQAVAVLSIPAIHLKQVVVQGTSAADTMNGPGLMPGTALPGTPGNAVIAGRRYTYGGPFGSLDSLSKGARIKIVDGVGTFTYRVKRVFTVVSGQHDVVVPTQDNRLTMVTSDGGVAPSGRLVVQASLVGTPVGLTSASVAVPTYELGLSGDPVAGGMAVLWSLVVILLIVGATFAAWRWKHALIIYLLTAPVVLACGLLACEGVARALPATF
jgi:sortase A